MRLTPEGAPAWHILLLSFSFSFSLFALNVLAKDEPNLSVTKFDHPFLTPRYFEDSDVILFHDLEEANVYRSSDAGAHWAKVKDLPDGKAGLLVLHPFDHKRAFVVTTGKTHYRSDDRGDSWHEFKTPAIPSRFQPEILIFHAGDPDRIIYNGMDCEGIFCDEQAFYSTDGLKTAKPLRSFTAGCWWAKSSPDFTTGDADLDKNRILCIIRDPFSLFEEDQRLVVSDQYFALSDDKDKVIQEFEPDMDTNRGVTGVVSLALVKRYLLVATSSFGSDEMALFVSDDTIKWHRAMFPTSDNHDHDHRINQEAYTVLESTNYSIQIDVMTSQPSRPMGVVFTSNSNGTYFTENVPYTNRNRAGLVDFEKISGIQGVFLVNTVENGPEVDKDRKSKVVVTQISFDDGRTFESIKAGGDRLHLHSVTDIDNVGRIFSSPAPGLVLGNGNTGKSLSKLSDADLYVSDNAGLTWKRALKGPHKYEFGDSGSILVAVKDSPHEDVTEFSYSLDHGEEWKSVALPDKLKMKPVLLTTTQDSTSAKFLLVGQYDRTFQVVAIDFEALGKRTCEEKDMEDWHARVDADGKPTCIMGHKETFRRRKKSADCFINSNFKDPVAKIDNCDCTDADFECDYNFQRDESDRTECKKVGPIVMPDGACKDKAGGGTFKGSSGWRLIPGNTCKRKGGDDDKQQKDAPVERKCSDDGSPARPAPPANGEVSSKEHVFEAELDNFQAIYLDRSAASTSDDETVIVRPIEDEGLGRFKVEQKLWLTKNHGKDWKRILEGETIQGIYPHPHLQDVVYFTTDSKKVIYTIDRGQTFHHFEAPRPFQEGLLPLSFHPDNKDWLLWVGNNCDTIGGKESCVKEASLSTDRGDNWSTILRFVERCEFTSRSAFTFRPTKQIVCLAREQESADAPWTVISSDDFFEADRSVFADPVTNFATMSEFIVLAAKEKESGDMRAMVSLDGKQYDKTLYPHNFREGHKNEYTVLDSSTHAVNLFVRAEGGADKLYGSIIKSNSNGTSYVLSASNVNCNEQTYVDFERVTGLEGVTLINVVSNADDMNNNKKKNQKKLLQTKISHNDGSEWGFLPPPPKDKDGKAYSCSSSSSSKGDESCALHLHHYTEREDKRKTFGADTAIGLLFGVGNVGPSLGDFKDADTFMSTDAGISWKNVKKGRWTWQYGDQGSIIVLVQKATPNNAVKTNIVSYSVDEGNTWKDYQFTENEVTVLDITTVRSGVSRNFLVWCRSAKGKLFSVNLDFAGLTDTPCKYEAEAAGDSDYYLWSPKHPLMDDDCLFGHVVRYLRKKADRKCYNAKDIKRNVENQNCECSRRDYECAFNYELDNHGQCKLVAGLKPISGPEWCSTNPNETSYFEPTGYRRLPLSTCLGGTELDKTATEHPCAGHEEEFSRKHRPSAFAIFLAVTLPVAAAACIGWYVFRRWDGKFGQIRLGENAASSFDSDRAWIKYPVIVVSAAVAVVAALPLVVGGLWRAVKGGLGENRFTTRGSFARRGDYSLVEDEGELLGEESDEEV